MNSFRVNSTEDRNDAYDKSHAPPSTIISSFTGDHFFLSNYFPSLITYNGFSFSNAEAAFQAMKCPERAAEFCHLSPLEAKRLGRCVKLREDWESVKETVMYEVCLAKFSQSAELKKHLLDTNGCFLVEGNDWGDQEWGVCNGIGKNKLGEILMQVRSSLILACVASLLVNFTRFYG